VYRTWFAIGLAGLLGGVAVVSLFVGFGSPVFLVVAAVSAAGGFLAYRYARERMLASVYAGVETDPARAGTDGTTDDATADAGGIPGDADRGDAGRGGERAASERDGATQATDGGETAADYDEWTWADSDPDDPFWSDDPEDWEDPWEWEATDPEEAAAGRGRWWERSGSGAADGSRRWSGWSDRTDGSRDAEDGHTFPGGEDRGPTLAEAYETLGLEAGADLDAVREAYRERVKETHPDRGGDPEAFIRVREAYERLREEIDGEG
jgi:hypothetical protein